MQNHLTFIFINKTILSFIWIGMNVYMFIKSINHFIKRMEYTMSIIYVLY